MLTPTSSTSQRSGWTSLPGSNGGGPSVIVVFGAVVSTRTSAVDEVVPPRPVVATVIVWSPSARSAGGTKPDMHACGGPSSTLHDANVAPSACQVSAGRRSVVGDTGELSLMTGPGVAGP